MDNRYRCTLYCDRTPATRRAMEALQNAGIPYCPTYEHSLSITPTLDAPVSSRVGLAQIEQWCSNIEASREQDREKILRNLAHTD